MQASQLADSLVARSEYVKKLRPELPPEAFEPATSRLLVIPATATTICYTWDTCVPCNTLNNTNERIDLPMTIAPNPFSSKAIVTFHQPVLDGQAQLTSLTGQLVRTYNVSGTQLTIQKDELAPGIYFFNVVTEAGVSAAQKLIVQ